MVSVTQTPKGDTLGIWGHFVLTKMTLASEAHLGKLYRLWINRKKSAVICYQTAKLSLKGYHINKQCGLHRLDLVLKMLLF